MKSWVCVLVGAMLLGSPASAETLHPLEAKDLAWRKRPNADEMARHFPAAAQRKGLPGWVVIECLTETTGDLKDCQVLNETPTDVGFGDAGLAMAQFFKLDASKMAPELLAGGVLTIPILMQTPDGVRRPAPPRTDLAGNPSALLLPAKGGTLPCPTMVDQARVCIAHPFAWYERPGLETTAPLVRKASASPPTTAVLCSIGVDMKLHRCARASPAEPSQVQAMSDLLPLFKASPETLDKVSGEEGSVLVQFDWPALKRAVNTSVRTRR